MAKRKGKTKREPRGKKPRFSPIHGSRFTQKDADYICPILLREYKARNGLTPNDVREMIKTKRHPLHRYCPSLEEAADRYMLVLASNMLRSFEIVYFAKDGGEQSVEHRTKLMHYIRQDQEDDELGPEEEDLSMPQVRPKSSAKPAGRNCYVTVAEVMATPHYQKQLMQRARQELQSFRNRYARLRELVDFKSRLGRVFAAICDLCDEA